MATTARVIVPLKALEDPLAHLPCSTILEYKKGQSIYNQDQPSTSIYLVIDGKVKVSRMADDGHQVILDIYQTDEFFGESALLNLPQRAEQATAMESTRLMSWTAAEIEDIVTKTAASGVWRCGRSWCSARWSSGIASKAFRWTILPAGWPAP